MGTLKIGSAKEQKGVTIEPACILFNGKNVGKIMSGTSKIWSAITYLYRLGNECTELTNGWTSSGYVSKVDGYGIASATKNANDMLIAGSSSTINVLGTMNTIDLTEYSKIYISVTSCNVHSNYAPLFDIKADKNILDIHKAFMKLNTTGIIEGDISDYNGLYYLMAYTYGTTSRNATINKIWLE